MIEKQDQRKRKWYLSEAVMSVNFMVAVGVLEYAPGKTFSARKLCV